MLIVNIMWKYCWRINDCNMVDINMDVVYIYFFYVFFEWFLFFMNLINILLREVY